MIRFISHAVLEGFGECYGRIQRHHNLIHAGRQVQRKFCILPACEFGHHKKANNPKVKEHFDQVMLNRATDEELEEFSRAINYKAYRDRLNIKYRVTNNNE